MSCSDKILRWNVVGIQVRFFFLLHTGESVSDPLILESVNPENCSNYCLNVKNTKKKYIYCTKHFLNLYFWGNSMNNLLTYCRLTDARMRASEKDLPVLGGTGVRCTITTALVVPKPI